MFSRETMGVIAIKVPVNQVWRDNSTNEIVSIYSPLNFPIDDFGWVCSDPNDGFYHSAYAAEMVADTADNLSFLRQCDTGDAPWPATEEAHLIGWPLKDFDETLCATTYLGDNYRLYSTEGENGEIVNGKYHTSLGNLESSSMKQHTVLLPNGSLKIKLQQTTVPLFENQAGSTITVNGIKYSCYYRDNGDGTYRMQIYRTSVLQYDAAITPQSVVSIEFRWGSAGINCLINGVSRYTDAGNTGSSEILQQVNVENIASSVTTSEYDFFDYEVRDAATSGDIYYMPMLDQWC